MSFVKPTGSGGPPPTGFGQRRARSASNDDTRAREAEIKMGDRQAEIDDQLHTVEREGQTAIDGLKENYDREAIAENSRQETMLESEKLKGYENFANFSALRPPRPLASSAKAKPSSRA